MRLECSVPLYRNVFRQRLAFTSFPFKLSKNCTAGSKRIVQHTPCMALLKIADAPPSPPRRRPRTAPCTAPAPRRGLHTTAAVFSTQVSRHTAAVALRKAAGATDADDRPREGAVALEELLDGAAHRGRPPVGLRQA